MLGKNLNLILTSSLQKLQGKHGKFCKKLNPAIIVNESFGENKLVNVGTIEGYVNEAM